MSGHIASVEEEEEEEDVIGWEEKEWNEEKPVEKEVKHFWKVKGETS